MISAVVLSTHFRVIGVLLIGLSMIHLIFPIYFNWKEELKDLSLMNRQMMKIHTFFIALIVFMVGVLCLYSTDDLVNTELGRNISLGIGAFWFVRLLVQFFGYSNKLWKGKTFESTVHIIFSAFWVYLTVIFLMNFYQD